MNWFGLIVILEISVAYLQYKQKELFTKNVWKEADETFLSHKTVAGIPVGVALMGSHVLYACLLWKSYHSCKVCCQIHWKNKTYLKSISRFLSFWLKWGANLNPQLSLYKAGLCSDSLGTSFASAAEFSQVFYHSQLAHVTCRSPLLGCNLLLEKIVILYTIIV